MIMLFKKVENLEATKVSDEGDHGSGYPDGTAGKK